jgi:hypothetical protein
VLLFNVVEQLDVCVPRAVEAERLIVQQVQHYTVALELGSFVLQKQLTKIVVLFVTMAQEHQIAVLMRLEEILI